MRKEAAGRAGEQEGLSRQPPGDRFVRARLGCAFDGRSDCFLEMGGVSRVAPAATFYAEPGPSVRLRRPGRRWHLAKVAFERYWLWRWFR